MEPTADITSAPAEPVAGEPVTFTAVSTYEAKGDVLSYAWEIDRGTGWESIGNKTNQLSLESTPSKEFNVRCTITANSTGCYTVYTLTPTTEPITPLPVEIIYFTAAKQGNNVLLEWATASEENNTGFEVEVSQDGFNFRKLDFVPTKNGNTVIKQVYTFKDTENGKYGTRYYRLKQIDMDGQFEYFTTKAVSFGEVSNYSLKAFPNPFEGEVNLELNADESGKLNVQVLDAMGRSVMTQQFEVSKGRSLEKITLWQSLPKGIYFVRTEMNGQANNFKLLKK
ncbi:T9SS type A sorting domain-containing protein [Pontibacter chinhatensis]|uniref:Por secretion system C-terminal sorting domain-containing protein n=1 Tax=Pontibacter chinhatensis TaxID=1436961 RepID=A0A1I2YFW8_9BACT|nr:T9SS type A sorting domain-containing protein [Pontibacter chinhatensis]SFH24229.1 Por secretion system C-terminal sorting domain-containing protein [Pontibacter chinhatensis]